MTPRADALLQAAANAVRSLLSAPDSSETPATLRAVDAILNELLLRNDASFFDRFRRAGMTLAKEGAALVEEDVREPLGGGGGAEAALDQLAQIVDRLSRREPVRNADFLDRVVGWELELYQHRMQSAPQLAGPDGDPRRLLTAERFQSYLRANRPEWADATVTGFRIQPGGFSKITAMVELTDDVGTHGVVIRAEPPLRMLDLDGMFIANEYPVIQIAYRAGLPVAEPLWLEPDPRHLGMPFLVSRKVPGKVEGTAKGSDQPLAADRVKALLGLMVRIHQTPIDARDPLIQACHLRRWAAHPTLRENTADFIRYWIEVGEVGRAPKSPLVVRGLNWLTANVPRDEAPACLLHGDISFANILFEQDRVSALLDWENARIGDPADELANFIQATRGNVDRGDIVRWYHALGGAPISEFRLRYFEVYNCVKMVLAALVSLRRVEDEPNGRANLAMFGLHFLHYVAREFNSLIAAAQASKIKHAGL